MRIDLELREIIDEVLDDSVNKKHLEAQYKTWYNLQENNGLTSLKDFLIGGLNGSLNYLFATYHGKKASMIEEDEQGFLNEILKHRVYGLESAIDSFCHKNCIE
jgi:hypothetical protein